MSHFENRKTGRNSPRYQYGVEWIAVNDEPSEMATEVVKDQISTILLADLFYKEPEEVAEDIIKVRKRGNE